MFSVFWCSLAFATCAPQAVGIRRVDREAGYKGACTRAGPPAEDAEVDQALSNHKDPKLTDRVMNWLGSLFGGEEPVRASKGPYDPLGVCPLNSQSDREAAAQLAGGLPIKTFQEYAESNMGILSRVASDWRTPINPATDPGILTKGPLPFGIGPTYGGIRTTLAITRALPAFVGTKGRNRTLFFLQNAIASCWNPHIMIMGPMLFKHSEVAPRITSRDQQRGYYMATTKQHPDFQHPEDLLFFGGERHRQFRQLFEKSGFARRYPIDAEYFRKNIPAFSGCKIPADEVFIKHIGFVSQKAIWGADPPADIMEQIMYYGKYGPFGIFGDTIHTVLGPVGIAGKVKTASDKVKAWGKTTPYGRLFLKARDAILAGNSNFSNDEVLLIGPTVASLFAGLVGTMDIAKKCVEFQTEDASHTELFQKHPEKYLIEVMRYDSAVTSVNEVMRSDTNMNLEGRNITFKAGTPQQLIIATANRDPVFWHRPEQFDPDRSQLAETLSWNGRAADVEARDLEKAPRHCPGYCLSLKVAAAVCASMMGSFEALLGQGKLLANGGEVKCNNFGTPNEPPLWTP